MVAVLGREGDVCGAIQGGIVGSEQTASNLASSTGMSSMFSWGFMGTSLCLRGVESGGTACPAPWLRVVEGVAEGGRARAEGGRAWLEGGSWAIVEGGRAWLEGGRARV